MSSIGFGGGVEAMVQPMQAPMPRTAMNATNTGIPMIQNRIGSRIGQSFYGFFVFT